MLPTIDSDSLKSASYAAEVVGKMRGVAKTTTLVSSAEIQTKITESAARIETAAQALVSAAVQRITQQTYALRVAMGAGRGVDQAFDALVAGVAVEVREGSVDRGTTNPDYLTVFPEGNTQRFTDPMVRQDVALGETLAERLRLTRAAKKDALVARVDAFLPAIRDAVAAMDAAEEQQASARELEYNARKVLIDALWTERRTLEAAVGRGGRALVRLLFADFRESAESRTPPADPEPDPAK